MTLQDEITPTINPGDDFYNYVNQKWRDAHPIPADKSRYAAFTELDERVTKQLHELLETPSEPDETYGAKLAKQLYSGGMDEAAIEARGSAPLQPLLDEIAALTSVDDIKQLIAIYHSRGLSLVWSLGLDVDEKNSQAYVMRVSQDGLLLPDRDYYFETGDQFDKVRAAYKTFLSDAFSLIGHDNAEARAQHVYDIEEALAKVSNTSIEDRDVEGKYNPMTFDELGTRFPQHDWQSYRESTKLDALKSLVVDQPKFLDGALELIKTTSLDAWKDYFTAHAVVLLMKQLPKSFSDLHFSFFGKILTGAEVEEDRYKRVIRGVAGRLPEPAGQLYVEKHFDESAKAAITDLVHHVQYALGERIKKLDWMSDDTKAKALEKLGTFMPLLGYPDKWRSYEKLHLTDDHAANVLAVEQFDWDYNVARATGPIDRHEWLMSPATVNAYYWPNTNGITFPAAILQSPFFDASGDFAANYGGIGEVIGHELSHGFDDQGAQYDKIGNLNSWWTDDDKQAFETRTKGLVKQFDGYEVEGQHVKGELTLGENIADLGGILIAYDALQAKLAETDNRQELDGFSPEQRFFMSQARCWRMNIRPEMAMQFVVTDPHSPAHLRVNGVVTNVDAWYTAWNIKEGDALYKPADQRVRIW